MTMTDPDAYDLTRLSDEELATLERLLARALRDQNEADVEALK